MDEFSVEITGTDDDTATQTGQSPVEVHSTATLPNTYPAQPFAKVHVVWGVIAKVNSPGTSTISEAIHLDTDLTNYSVDVHNAVQSVWNLWYAWSASTPLGLQADVEIHWSIRLANPTAPPPPMGGWLQAKQHYDGHLSAGNIKSSWDIEQPIVNNIPYMAKIAKYA